ncbi:MAG: hypothetical protein RL088_403 [Verrucomicrobiota bacterium]
MDPKRYNALVASDAVIPGELAKLDESRTPRRATQVPPGIESASWTTMALEADTEVESESPAPMTSTMQRGSNGRLQFWLILLAGGGFVFWLVFVKRWQVD